MTTTRRACALLAVTALVATGSAALLGGTAYADATTGTNDNRYSLTAEGDGMYAYVYNGLLPAVPYVDASAYTAEAENTSQGQSSAFAGLPYPGKTGTTLPGTVNGLSGGNFPPLPPLPGYVSTNYPSSKDMQQTQGPYLIHATSDAQSSSATAGGGVSPNAGSTNQQVYSTANVIANADGTVTAKATAGVDGINIGPIDALNVGSTMTITSDGVSKPKVVTGTNLGTFQILGFKIGIDEKGFEVLGDNLSLPATTILNQVNAALAASGFKIEVIPGDNATSATTGQTTATSATLRITETYNAPVAGPSKVITTFGRATASVANFAIDNGTGGDTTGGTTGGTSTGGTTAGATSGDLSSTGGTTGSGVSPDPGLGGSTAPGTSTSGDLTGPPAPIVGDTGGSTGGTGNTGSHPSALGFITGPPKGTETWALYLVLVLAGVGVIGGQQLFRMIGVRLALREA